MIINPTKIKRQTKNNLYNLFNRALCILALFLMAIVFVPTNNSISYATSIDQQIQDASNKLGSQKTESKTLASEVASFDSQIQNLESQIWATQTEMNNLTSQIDSLNKQIAENESSLKIQKETLNEYMRVIYEESNTSTLELVASSNNFSDFVDKTEYLQTMQVKVKDMVENIKKLRGELEQKKKDIVAQKDKVADLSKQQNLQKRAVDNQQAAKANLLAQSKGQEGTYQQMLSSLYAQRAAAARDSGQSFGGGGGTGGYPTHSCIGTDEWKFYNCQCTSYVAWKSSVNGPVSSSVLLDWGSGHVANGADWAYLGASHGYTVNSSPSIGSIAIWPIHSLDSGAPYYYNDIYGHVAIVTGISGGTISVEEYNFINPEAYGTRSKVPISWTNNYNGNSYSLSFIK